MAFVKIIIRMDKLVASAQGNRMVWSTSHRNNKATDVSPSSSSAGAK
jgi:hypothetical protein